jgi:hypothetical protein
MEDLEDLEDLNPTKDRAMTKLGMFVKPYPLVN